MKCGNCKGDHGLVAEVRACYAQPVIVETGGQTALMERVNVPGNGHVSPSQRDAGADRAALFADMKVLRESVPAGRYAVTGEDGVMKFYRIDKPTKGAWAGYTFIKVQAGDEYHKIRGMRAEHTILTKVAVNPAEASMRYGREIGACGVCGRTLTDPNSISDGIGPVCATKMGW